MAPSTLSCEGLLELRPEPPLGNTVESILSCWMLFQVAQDLQRDMAFDRLPQALRSQCSTIILGCVRP